MKSKKRKRLQETGWKLGSAGDFLGLSGEERALVQIKLALAMSLRERRLDQALTQTQLAEKIQSSQSRVAKMEAGDASVSIDLLIKTLLALGCSPHEVGRIIARRAA